MLLKMSLLESHLEQEMLQDVYWQSHLGRDMLQAEALGARHPSVSSRGGAGRGTWSKTFFRISLADALEQEMLQDVAEALVARNASRCLWQRHLEQEDVSGRSWSKRAKMLLERH